MAVDIPPFWLQLAYYNNSDLLDLVPEFRTGKLAIGSIAGPHSTEGSNKKSFQGARSEGPAIFDPFGEYIERTEKEDSATRKRDYPFLSNSKGVPTSAADYQAWMKKCITIQEDSSLAGDGDGPSFIVTPSRVLKPSSNFNGLYRQLNAAESVEISHSEKWMGISLSKDFVLDDGFRTALLDQLVDISESGFSGVVLRVFDQAIPPYKGARFLAGIREVVGTLNEVDLKVLMAASGFLGWLAMGWGASGFSAGWARGSWWCRERSPMSNPLTDRNYYFERQLLCEIPWAEHLRLTKVKGHRPCTCVHCIAMGKKWDKEHARKHHVLSGALAANKLAPQPLETRTRRVSKALDSAIKFRDSIPDPILRELKTGFLDDWQTAI
ncbi:MAG: hypothetical protein ACRDKE_09130 [Solirubrobacterales bacterium]